jgi:hypothetical protein
MRKEVYVFDDDGHTTARQAAERFGRDFFLDDERKIDRYWWPIDAGFERGGLCCDFVLQDGNATYRAEHKRAGVSAQWVISRF